MARVDRLVEQWRDMGVVRWAEHRFGWILPETGQPIELEPWQRAVLDAWEEHRATCTTLAISNLKKTGKTLTDAVLTCWRWLTLGGLHFCAANDLDQSTGRQFQMVAEMVKGHPLLCDHVEVTRDRLTFTPTGAVLQALAVDATGNAGANHWTASHTEAWGIIHEGGIRAFEELTPPPGRKHGLPALRICDSYAGWLDESTTWHDLVDRGLAGERLPGDWPIYHDGGLVLFHIDGTEAQERCFRGTAQERERYYAEQRASLRPGAFSRMHLNTRAAGDDRFVEPEQWDSLIDPSARCPAGGESLSIGLDVGYKNDHCAVVSVYWRDRRLFLGPYRIWIPSPVVDLQSVEDYIEGLRQRFSIATLAADPYQAIQMLQRLKGRGVRVIEYAQSTGNLTAMAGALHDTVKQRSLVVYPGSDALRSHVLAAVARESSRGLRLVKETGSRKIDGAVALSMALVQALDDPAARTEPISAEIYQQMATDHTPSKWVVSGRRRGLGEPTHSRFRGRFRY